MSFVCGGPLRGYYLNDKLVLIKATSNANMYGGFTKRDFYVKGDSLLFVSEKAKYYMDPDEKYEATHKDKNGDIDYSKLPVAILSDNKYYFSDSTIVNFQLKEFGKIKRPMEDEILEANQILFKKYKGHVIELIKGSNSVD